MSPALRLLRFMFAPAQLWVALVLVLVIFSALGVSFASFKTRDMYSDLQVLTRESDELDSEYEKLLLEQSVWAGFGRVDEVSRKELGMAAPERREMVLVKP